MCREKDECMIITTTRCNITVNNKKKSEIRQFKDVSGFLDYIDEYFPELPVLVYLDNNTKSTSLLVKICQLLWERDFKVRGVR